MPALRNPIISNAVPQNLLPAQRQRQNQVGSGGSTDFGGAINQAIPGFDGLTSSATGIIRQLMSGLPSAGSTQRANAYFGAGSGMPGSDFVRNRGFDLYGEKSEQYKQQGFQDLLALLQGYSGTVAPNTGQQIQSDQFQQDFDYRAGQDAIDNQRQRSQFNRQNPQRSRIGIIQGGPGESLASLRRYQT